MPQSHVLDARAKAYRSPPTSIESFICVIALVETPCIGVCRIDPDDGLCTGCSRSLDEIARWSSMGEVERRAVMAVLPDRRPRHRQGGRSARLRRLAEDSANSDPSSRD